MQRTHVQGKAAFIIVSMKQMCWIRLILSLIASIKMLFLLPV